MKKFEGFSPQFDYSRIPTPFFKQILPEINHLGELKVTLYFFWQIEQMEGDFRYLRKNVFFEDEKLTAKINMEDLEIGLEKAVERGTFLKANVELDNKNVELFFVNTLRGRNAVEALLNGLWEPTGDPSKPITLDMDRPNIFRLYEENIGPLTPLISDSLKEAETLYPIEWIKEAIAKALENNARNWRYVLAILERWKEEGKNGRRDQKNDKEDYKKYTEGEFSDFIDS